MMLKETIKKVILEKQELILKNKFISRNIYIPSTEQITIFTGPRRAGKSSLMQLVARKVNEHVRGNSNFENILFLDFDDERLIELNTLKNYDLIINSYKELYPKLTPIIFFDEVQSLKNWHLYIKRLYSSNYKIYLSGSNANLLSKEISTYLSGRSIEVYVPTFSFSEYLRLKKLTFDNKDLTLKTGELNHYLNDYLKWGGFPEIIGSEDKLFSAKSILNLSFYKDLIAKHDFDEYPIKLLISKLTENIGKPFSYSKLANKLSQFYKITKPSLINYIEALKQPYLIHELPLYKKSFISRQSERKVYFLDNSTITLNSIESDQGKLLENMVFNHFKRDINLELFYYKTSTGKELDLLIKSGSNLEAIQIVYNLDDHDTFIRETTALEETMKELKVSKGQILTYNLPQNVLALPKGIKILPVLEILKN